jgi:multiple sugar transport system permease protein
MEENKSVQEIEEIGLPDSADSADSAEPAAISPGKAAPAAKSRRKGARLEKSYWGYIFILPFFVAYCLFSLFPLVTTFYYSLTDKSTFGVTMDGEEEYSFVGLRKFYHLEEGIPIRGRVCPDRSHIITVAGMECEIQVDFSTGEEYIIYLDTEYVLSREPLPDVLRGTATVPNETSVEINGLTLEHFVERGNTFIRIELDGQFDEDGNVLTSRHEVLFSDDGKSAEIRPIVWALVFQESGVFGVEGYRRAFWNTPLLWIMGFIPQMSIALLLAAWFTDAKIKARGQGFFKVIFYMPNIMTAATIGALFLAFTDNGGLLHQLAVAIGYIESDELLNSVWYSRGIIAFINYWMWFGNTMIVLIAGILGISPSLFEAASIDGANGTKMFWRITIPQIRPILTFSLVQSLIGGFQMYDIPAIMQDSVASNLQREGTTTVMTSIMGVAFQSVTKDLGLASAISVTLFAMTTVCSVTIFALMKDRSDDKWLRKQKKLEKLQKKGGVVSNG